MSREPWAVAKIIGHRSRPIARSSSLSPKFAPMRTVGDGTRVLNFLVDTLIIFLLAYFAFKGWNWYVLYWEYTPYNFGWFFFGILFVYYFLFESLFSKTPGKWFSYSKVVTKEGKKANIGWILIRSLTRVIIIDLFFIPFLGKPLHDYLSRTILIEG
jgi:uncharacterized RDD family membrane protein YckC